MNRSYAISAAFVVALFAVAAAQDKKELPAKEQPAEVLPAKDKLDPPKEKPKKPDITDAVIAAALSNDPDVKIAQARVQLAEAELAKAKQTVVMKVMPLADRVNTLRADVEQHRERAAWAERMVKLAYMSQAQAQVERAKLQELQAELAKIETELKLIAGEEALASKADIATLLTTRYADQHTLLSALRFMNQQQQHHPLSRRIEAYSYLAALAARPSVKGPISEQLRAALDKSVKLGNKGEEVTFPKALEVFKKEAGLDVPVRYGFNAGSIMTITAEGEELPVGAWFQLYQDQANGGGVFYVRDYGLLFAGKDSAPDAPTLTEFWKQKPPAKEKEREKVTATVPKEK
jgi:hypothetical protein